MIDETQTPKKQSISEMIKSYGEMRNGEAPNVTPMIPRPASTFNQQEFERAMAQETDPDLMTSYEVVKLPSRGLFYPSRISEVSVEYMTSKDEDLLTTPSLIENGTVLDVLLKRKIKSTGIHPDDLLSGDRNAIILFLRSSSYGSDYTVQVVDPRTGVPFKAEVDLLKLKHKELTIMPDQNGFFTVELPMRKKIVTFKLLTYGEETKIYKKAQAIQDAYGQEFSEYNTMKLKAHIVDIGGKTDRTYIDKFVDAMPALDSFTIRKKIIDASPDVDMKYEFETKDGLHKFFANLSVGIDFFFPST